MTEIVVITGLDNGVSPIQQQTTSTKFEFLSIGHSRTYLKEFISKFKHFHSRKCISNWCLKKNTGQFVPCKPQIAKFMGPTWGPPGSCWPQIGPMNLAIRVDIPRFPLIAETAWSCYHMVLGYMSDMVDNHKLVFQTTRSWAHSQYKDHLSQVWSFPC